MIDDLVTPMQFLSKRTIAISTHFQRHFLLLGLQGGALGGGVAVLLFALADLLGRWFAGSAGAEQASALFGSFSIGPWGYAAVLGQIVLIAAVTALASRHTVNSTLEAID